MKLYFILGSILIALIVGGISGYYFCKSGIPKQLTDQQMVDKKTCEKDQQITKDANDALQKDYDSALGQLNSLKLQHPTACVHIAESSKPVGAGHKYADDNGKGISSDWLRSYAAIAEYYRSEVGVCLDFLAKERTVSQPE